MTKRQDIKKATASPSRKEVWKMFDRIAPRYDLLNRMLSFGRDIAWREELPNYMPSDNDLNLLDLATGTGDVVLTLVKKCPRIKKAVGIDMAGKMLAIGREKIHKLNLDHVIELKHGDASDIPEDDNHYDIATIAFGIRNLVDVNLGLREMFRVLKPGGRALILEFSLPSNPVIKWGYLLYFRHILPVLGGIISGDYKAYRYLNKTVETFPYGAEFCNLMNKAGFANIKPNPLTFGIATIYQGDKPAA